MDPKIQDSDSLGSSGVNESLAGPTQSTPSVSSPKNTTESTELNKKVGKAASPVMSVQDEREDIVFKDRIIERIKAGGFNSDLNVLGLFSEEELSLIPPATLEMFGRQAVEDENAEILKLILNCKGVNITKIVGLDKIAKFLVNSKIEPAKINALLNHRDINESQLNSIARGVVYTLSGFMPEKDGQYKIIDASRVNDILLSCGLGLGKIDQDLCREIMNGIKILENDIREKPELEKSVAWDNVIAANEILNCLNYLCNVR